MRVCFIIFLCYYPSPLAPSSLKEGAKGSIIAVK